MQSAPHYVVKTHAVNGLLPEAPKAVVVRVKTTPSASHERKSQPEKRKYLAQLLATLAVSIGPFAAGLGKGYSSPAIASLQDMQQLSPVASNSFQVANSSSMEITASSLPPPPLFTVTPQQTSWVASLSLLGALFGAMFGGVSMRFGRRKVLLATAIPFSASWILTVFAVNVHMMFATSFIGGFCCAIILMVSQIYISEIADSNVRGCLSAVQKIFAQIGVLISFAIGAYLNWRQLATAISAAPILLFFAVLYIPETPGFLVLSGRMEEAAESLAWLKGGTPYEIHRELSIIRNNIAEKRNNRRNRHAFRDVYRKLARPIFVTCGLTFFQRFSGANAFNFYAVSVFRQTFGGMNPHGGAITVSFVQLLASLLSGLLVDTAGRLPLLLISGALMSIALAAFGSFAYYEHTQRAFVGAAADTLYAARFDHDWIPLLCVLVFTVAFSLGISPITWLLVGELFPLEFRALGTGLVTTFSYGCAFIGVKTFVDFQQTFGLHGTFWIYSATAFAGLCFVVCCVPETRGRDLDEMERHF